MVYFHLNSLEEKSPYLDTKFYYKEGSRKKKTRTTSRIVFRDLSFDKNQTWTEDSWYKTLRSILPLRQTLSLINF